MTKMILQSLLILSFALLSGCSEARTNDTGNQASLRNQSTPSNDFKHHLQHAGSFLELKHVGDAYRNEGKYELAIDSYKKALKDHAHSRPEQAIASERLGMTYEEMGNYDEASKYYDLASEVTMNEDRKISLSNKAQELRQRTDFSPTE